MTPKRWVIEWLAEANADCSPYEQFEPRHVVAMLQDEHGISLVEAYYSVFIDSDKFFPEGHEDWKSYARFLAENTSFDLTFIASLVSGWLGEQCASTVHRLFDPDAPEKRKKHDATYWAKLQQDEERYEARKARMREYSREHYRRNK